MVYRCGVVGALPCSDRMGARVVNFDRVHKHVLLMVVRIPQLLHHYTIVITLGLEPRNRFDNPSLAVDKAYVSTRHVACDGVDQVEPSVPRSVR